MLGLEKRNGKRNSGIPILNKTRTEIYYIKKENIFSFQQKNRFLEKNKTGGIMLRKISFPSATLLTHKELKSYEFEKVKRAINHDTNPILSFY